MTPPPRTNKIGKTLTFLDIKPGICFPKKVGQESFDHKHANPICFRHMAHLLDLTPILAKCLEIREWFYAYRLPFVLSA